MARTPDTLRKALQSTIETKLTQATNAQRHAANHEAAGRPGAAAKSRSIADNSLASAGRAMDSLKKL